MKARNPLKDPQPGDVFTTLGVFPEVITITGRGTDRKGVAYVQFHKGDGVAAFASTVAMAHRLHGATIGSQVHAVSAPQRKTA